MFREFMKSAAAAAVASALFAAPALAQQGQTPPEPTLVETHGKWTFECSPAPIEGGEFCTMQQVLTRTETQQIVLAMTIAYQVQSGKLLMIAMTPLGVELPVGLGLKVDDGPQLGIPYANCTQQGCRAAAPLTDPLLGQLKGGNELKVSYAVQGQRLDAPVSLEGFTAAYNRLLERKPPMPQPEATAN